MIDSLTAIQIDRIKELGAWRDENCRFAVGLDGEVFKHHVDQKEEKDGNARKGTAGWERTTGREGTAGREGAPGRRAAAHAEPAGADRRETLTERYLGFRPEILRYYPTAHFQEVNSGLWIVARSYPLGRDGPCYWICLFLPDNAVFSPKAFAFEKLSPIPRAIGVRHTNFPDASICAFTDEDDAWRPGYNPKTLLNLYAEWLICHLFCRVAGYWPGRQSGLNATYRVQEFLAVEWCDCESGRRYGECHFESDLVEVQLLIKSGTFVPLPERIVPPTVIKFVKSRWKKFPDLDRLPMHAYKGKQSQE